MTNDKIEKLREAAEAIAEIVKQHKAEGEAIRKALEPLRDVVEPRIIEKVVEVPVSRGWPEPLPVRPLPIRFESDPPPYVDPFRCQSNQGPETVPGTLVINRVLPNGRTSWHVPGGATA